MLGVRFITLRAALLAALLTGTACVSAPVQEMSNARQAIAAAEDAGAADHAPADLAAAQTLLSRAEQRLQDKRYREARRAAVAAKMKAAAALEASGQGD